MHAFKNTYARFSSLHFNRWKCAYWEKIEVECNSQSLLIVYRLIRPLECAWGLEAFFNGDFFFSGNLKAITGLRRRVFPVESFGRRGLYLVVFFSWFVGHEVLAFPAPAFVKAPADDLVSTVWRSVAALAADGRTTSLTRATLVWIVIWPAIRKVLPLVILTSIPAFAAHRNL